jgi:peptidoglycan/xylan/chitin deacetylase (PgdA/CDA1 family)
MNLKRSAKLIGLQTMRGLGLFHLTGESDWRSRRLLILAYHGFALEDEDLWEPGLFLSATRFEMRLRQLKSQGCTVLPLAVAVARLYQGTLPPKSVVITIDDGNYDFYAKALPLLRRYGYPATVYLTTYYCEYNKPLFPHACSYMLWKRRGAVIRAPGLADSISELDLRTDQSRGNACRNLLRVAEAQHFSAGQKNDFAERLARVLSIEFGELIGKRLFHRMNADEVAEIAGAGIDVQLHTHRHRVPEEHSLFLAEIEENRAWISARTGRTAHHFCYPSGVWKPEFLPWLSEMGIISATTCVRGLASPGSQPLLLPRVLDGSHVSSLEFDGWICGLGFGIQGFAKNLGR